MKNARLFFLLFFLLFPVILSFSANVAIPSLELTTRGYLEEGAFKLNTRGNMDLLFEGGYKFGGRVILNFESDSIEEISGDATYLSFKTASVVIRDFLSLPIDLTYFTGEYDIFCTGDIFPDYYGTEAIASDFRGYVYFPDGIQYNGIYLVNGTGLKFSSSFGTDWNNTSLYIYQDSYLGTGHFSADFNTIINLEKFKLEAFLGGSFPVSDYGFYRTGVLLFYKTGEAGEFLTEIGIPKWDPMYDPFEIDLFYFLFEPRVKFNIMSIIMTLFWHPGYYKEYLLESTNELGSVDINMNLLFGKPKITPLSGGVESCLSFSTFSDDQFTAVVSPYFNAITSGVIWNLKLKVKLFPFSLENIAEAFIGVKAEF